MYCIYNVLTSRKSNSICLFLRLIYKHTCTHIWIYIFTLISERKKKKSNLQQHNSAASAGVESCRLVSPFPPGLGSILVLFS